jgi:two-component system OmpR family sensor kinase
LTLRARVSLFTTAAFAIGLLAIGLTVPSLVRGYLTDRIDRQLELAAVPAAIRLLAPEVTGGDVPREIDAGPAGDAVALDSHEFASLWAGAVAEDGTVADGRLVFPIDSGVATPDLDMPADLDTRVGIPFDVDAGEAGTHRALVVAAPIDGDLFVVALPLTSVHETVARVVVVLGLVSAVVLVAVGAGVWWLVGWGLRPLVRMEDSADEIVGAGFEPANRGRRLPVPAPVTEVGRLARTLNELLDVVDTSLAEREVSETRLRRFVADASHELRTPLTSIRGYAELYRRGATDAGAVGQQMRRIEEQAARMSRLVDDLLTLARLDESRRPEASEVELTVLVADAVADARAADPARRWSYEPDGPVVVSGDRDRLTQVVANLLANASVHTPPGTPVEVTVGREHDVASLVVSDHGPGVPEAVRDAAFDRFVRADPARSRVGGGSGLGLAIVRTIVDAHGGAVRVDDAVGGGAQFVVELPCASMASQPSLR